MVTYTIFMKELSATSTWQDVTHATIIDKGLPLRKGFGSLSDAIDVGSVSLTLHMESLDAAALLHTSRKQVLIHADGAPIFEGVSFDDADVDLDMNTDYIYASLKFKPYSSLFEQAKVPSDTVLTDVKICDPADAEHSLVHILFGMIVENMPEPLPAIISPSFGITTSVSNTKVLPLVILEKGESLEDILTSALYQNGYTYYMEQFSVILIEPYASGREPTSQVPITSILAKPSISQAPYIKETKCSVRFPRVEQYANEVVYELNGDRIEGTDEPSQVQVLEPADYYPTDDEEPATLEADYSTERETDDIELVYVTGATLDVHTRALSGDSTVRVHITAGTHELDPTKARIQLYNNLSYDVSLRNIRVLAGIAYYRNWSALYEDDDTTATDTDEIDGLFMPDTATARAFISRYRSEISAEKTSVEFSTHLDFAPGTLIELAGLPYWLLIRSVTDRRDGSDIKDYSCVAYRIHTVETSTRIRVSGNAKVRNAFSPVPVRLFALGNAEAPYEDSIVVADDAMIASDNNAILGASAAWQLTRPTPGAGEYVWYIIGWYTPPSTWPQTWTVPVKDEGLAAYALQLSAPEGTNFYMSGRGVLQTATLKFTAILSNIPPASVVWTASNGTLIEVEGDAYSRELDCSTVSQDNVQITITAMVAGQSYSATIGVQRVRGTAIVTKLPMATTETPKNVNGEPLVSGDFFLVGAEFIEGGVTYKVGTLWEYDGSGWNLSDDAMKGLDAMDDFASIAEEAEDGVFCQLIAKRVYAQKAVIEEIGTKEITLKTGGKIQSEVYTPGVAGFQIRADGSVDLINASMVSGLFTGTIDSPPLTTTNEGTLGNTITFDSITHWYVNDAMSVLASQLTPNRWHNISGSHDSVAISKLAVVTTANTAVEVAYNSVSSTARPISFTVTVPYTATLRIRHKSRYYWDDWEYYPEYVTLYRNGVVIYQSSPTYYLAYIDMSLNKGDVITYYGNIDEWIDTDEDHEVAWLKLEQIFTTQGLYFVKNNVLGNLPKANYESARLQIASPSFDSDSSTYKKYAKSTAFLAGVSSYSNDVFKTAQGTVIINGTSRTVNGVMKTSTGMTVFHNAGSQALAPVSSDPGTSGYYNMSGSYQVQTTVEGAATMNLNAKTADTYSIGTTVRYLNMAAKTMIAETFDNSSARDKKKDITPFLGSALDILKQVQVVNYRYKTETGEYLHTGFIADDAPDPLTGADHNSMSLGDNIGMLIKAVQELYQLILGGPNA
ncbi:MAG: tail fiber domain-containing protein [Synergistaceae bacterium]|jgi:hypothetical protein